MTDPPLRIRPFVPRDQAAVRRLILAGLGERFGFVDETLNPDLDDIAATYLRAGHLVDLVEVEGAIVGVGILVADGPGVGRLVRMSVSAAHRRRGIGRALVAHLIGRAERRGDRRLLLETNDDWHDAIRLYRTCGFVEIARVAGDVHLALDLSPARARAAEPIPDAPSVPCAGRGAGRRSSPARPRSTP